MPRIGPDQYRNVCSDVATLAQSRALEGCGDQNNSMRTVAVFYRRVALLSSVLIEKAAANLKILLKPGW
jgi:hypothetical protein